MGGGPRDREIEYQDVPVEDEVALMRAAMIVGLGIEYNLSGKTALLLGATFSNGLFNVANNEFRSDPRRGAPEGVAGLGYRRSALSEGYDRKMVDNAILRTLDCSDMAFILAPWTPPRPRPSAAG